MIYISDHIARGLSLVVSQFQRSPRLLKVIEGLLDEVQRVEDAMLDVDSALDIESATGAQLDQMGLLLGERRDGLDDITYRRYLTARSMIRIGQGSTEDVIGIAATLSGGAVEYSPAYPAGYRIHLTAPVPDALKARFKARLTEATPAGVGLEVTQATSDDPFTFDNDALGFDQGHMVEIY